MKITKVINRIGIGTRIKVRHRNGISTVHTLLSLSTTDRWYTDRGYYLSKDLTIEGQDGIIAIWKPIPFKRFKFRYKK